MDDHLCTLEEVFQKVNHSLGFNIELKFDDKKDYTEDVLVHLLQLILQVGILKKIFNYAIASCLCYS